MTEQEFVMRAQAIQGRLYQMALLYFGSESIAKDVLDETIYRGLKGYRKVKQEDFFETWLTRILLNECHREWKYQKKKTSLEALPKEQASDGDSFEDLPLKLAIQSLPRELKDVILMRFYEGKSIRETAEILKIPDGTVSSRQRKALKLLQQDLEEVEG